VPGRDGRSLPALAASPRWVCLVSHGGSRRFHVSCAEGPHDCIYFLPNAQDRTISLHLLLPGNAAATSPTHTAKQICEPPPPHQQHPFDHTLPRGPPITAQRPFVIGSSHAPGFGLCWSRPSPLPARPLVRRPVRPRRSAALGHCAYSRRAPVFPPAFFLRVRSRVLGWACRLHSTRPLAISLRLADHVPAGLWSRSSSWYRLPLPHLRAGLASLLFVLSTSAVGGVQLHSCCGLLVALPPLVLDCAGV